MIFKSTAHCLTGLNHKTIGDIYRANDMARSLYAHDMKRPIKFDSAPGNKSWCDVEAGEVDHGKNVVDDGCPSPHDAASTWEHWGGVQQRGAPRALTPTRLGPKQTVSRAPGPGPIREGEWKKYAQKHLQNRRVILHTDGARAHKLKVPGVIHGRAVHAKKKLKDRGEKPVSATADPWTAEGAAAAGSWLAGLARPCRCRCSWADSPGALELLEKQLDRCGPENL
ncbi:unnamed protein product [Prorocentrum cordatum]|uniref:Uncharacterized protein n=1 Tax=Prorocentrum cordatum TaxID=2364126 RepID=A0ABN9QV96_9DINO|nr:unnamed protein product [Polarella glacialis]